MKTETMRTKKTLQHKSPTKTKHKTKNWNHDYYIMRKIVITLENRYHIMSSRFYYILTKLFHYKIIYISLIL